MHWLETEILKRLTLKNGLRYTDLRPKEVENNHFTYHVKKLVAEGLIEMNDAAYTLTPKGSAFVDRVSLSTFATRVQPKIVTVIACFDASGRILLHRRAREPFSGLVGLPYGKMHLGERVADAASRELREKTGLTAEPSHCGDAYLTILDRGELATHMLCHVFVARGVRGELASHTRYGEAFWCETTDIKKHSLIPGFDELIKLVTGKQSERFFCELIASGDSTTRL